MWGMGGWTGSDDDESLRALDRRVALGCNFFDTAWAYGEGKSEQLLGEALRAIRGTRLYVATKIPPKNLQVAGAAEYPLQRRLPRRSHPRVHREEPRRTSASRRSTCSSSTSGATRGPTDEGWQRAVDDLKREGLDPRVRHQRQPLGADQRAARARDRPDRQRAGGLQHLRPGAGGRAASRTASAHDIAVIARVPFDEGSLTGTLTTDIDVARGRLAEPLLHAASTWRRRSSAVDGSSPLVPDGMDLPELALRFILRAPGGEHDDSRACAGRARRAESGGQRRRRAARRG